MNNAPHNINITTEIQQLDLNGRLVKKQSETHPLISPFIKLGGKIFPGRSFVREFLEQFYTVVNNGIDATYPYNVRGTASQDFGILLDWDQASTKVLKYVRPSDTYAGLVGAEIQLPSVINAGAVASYGANSLDADITELTYNGLQAAKFQLRRTLTNGATQKVIRDVLIAAKKNATTYLLSRDAFVPYTSEAASFLPKGQVLAPSDALEIAFDFILSLKQGSFVAHKNLLRYFYNALFYGSVTPADLLAMEDVASATAYDPAVLAYKLKVTPDVAGTNGLDICLLSPNQITDPNHSFSPTSSDSVISGLTSHVNTEFATKTLTLNNGSASIGVDGNKSTMTIEKLFSGHTSDYPLRAAMLFMDDDTNNVRHRLASWEKQQAAGSFVTSDVITTDRLLKVVFKFEVDCGAYSYNKNTNVIDIQS